MREIVIGSELTVRTECGGLPGTHRGTVVRQVQFDPFAAAAGAEETYELSVFVPCRGRHETILFVPSQIVPDGTPTTDLSIGAMLRLERELAAARAWHAAAARGE